MRPHATIVAVAPTCADAATTAAATIGVAITASQATSATASAYIPCLMRQQLLILAFVLRSLCPQSVDSPEKCSTKSPTASPTLLAPSLDW